MSNAPSLVEALSVATANTSFHTLKCWPQWFEPLLNQSKQFEVRQDDRAYQVGDLLFIREWNPDSQQFTGREVLRRVVYKLTGCQGLSEGYCVLGLQIAVQERRFGLCALGADE